MSISTDNVLRKLKAYIDEHESEIRGEEDFNRLAADFMLEYNQNLKNKCYHEPTTSDDYLELAESAPSRNKYIEYLNKALELDSDNLDAARMLIDETVNNSVEAIEKYQTIIKKGAKYLKKRGYFDEAHEHEFWLAFETRPYMRARYWYMRLLTDCGSMRQAASECEEMLELCRSDNLGVRYDLMHLYAFLEDERLATKLFNRYKEISAHFMLPYSILYFKLGNLEKSASLLKKLTEKNLDTKKFLRAMNSKNGNSLDKYAREMGPYGERVDSIDEFIGELHNYEYLLTTVPVFFIWADKELKKKKAK